MKEDYIFDCFFLFLLPPPPPPSPEKSTDPSPAIMQAITKTTITTTITAIARDTIKTKRILNNAYTQFSFSTVFTVRTP